MNKLTKEQQKLVEDNHNLIYGFAKLKNINLDEYYDLLAIALCRAAMKFDLSKGSFTNFTYLLMDYAIKHNSMSKTRQKRIPENKICSYDNYVKTDSEDKTIFLDKICSTDTTHGIGNSRLAKEELVKSLNEQEIFVFNKMVEGYSQRDISKILGISRQRIGQVVSGIRKKALKVF